MCPSETRSNSSFTRSFVIVRTTVRSVSVAGQLQDAMLQPNKSTLHEKNKPLRCALVRQLSIQQRLGSTPAGMTQIQDKLIPHLHPFLHPRKVVSIRHAEAVLQRLSLRDTCRPALVCFGHGFLPHRSSCSPVQDDSTWCFGCRPQAD